jgi:hypothetical protein
MSERKRPAATPKLQAEIDNGRSDDKVRAIDPAVVPLGTDDEAAGTTMPPEAIGPSRHHERSASVPTDPDRSNRYQAWRGVIAWLTVVGLLAAALLSAILLVGR